METPSIAAKRTNPMLVVTLIALEAAAGAPVRSGTGGPVAVASTPAITGPVAAAYKYVKVH